MGDDGTHSNETVTLVWGDHSQLLAEGIWKSFKDKVNIDVKFRSGDSDNGELEVGAHRLVLSILCPRLDINEKLSSTIEHVINFDVNFHDFHVLFEFLYCGKVTLASKRLKLLRKCAEALKADRIVEIIDEYCIRMEDLKMEERNLDLSQIARRKRKSTPVKLQKNANMSSDIEKKIEIKNKLTENEVKRRKRKQKVVESEAYNTESEENDDNDIVYESRKSKGGPKPNKNSSAATRKRTAYKRIWRMNQPLQKCPHCSYETRDKESYRNHINRHNPAAERYVCRYCEKTFKSKRGFGRHQNIHLKPERIQRCPLCSYLTPLRSTMVQHMGTVHQADLEGKPLTGKFKCPDCDFNCMFECHLKLHMIRKHKKERPFKCSECNYSAVLKADLDKHVMIRHRMERPYMCEICGFRSQSQGGYNRHKRSHTGEKPFRCELCGKQYADSRKYKIHVLRHEKDEKPFTCHLCGHSCRRKDNLKMHLKRIHKTDLDGDSMVIVSCNLGDAAQEETNLALTGIACGNLPLQTENNRAGRNQSITNCLAISAQTTSVHVENLNSEQRIQQQSNVALLNNAISDTVFLYN